MRFYESKPGERRIKKRFLILPKKINGEIRWFEFAKWEEICRHKRYHNHGLKWYKSRWVDE